MRRSKGTRRRANRVARQGRRYGRVVSWVGRYVVRRFGVRIALLLMASTVGLALIGAGLGLAVAIATSFEAGGNVALFGLELGPTSAATLPWLAVGVALLIGAGSAGVFVARRSAAMIAGACRLMLIEDILSEPGGLLPNPGDYSSDRRVARAVSRLMNKDSRRMSLALRRSLDAPVSMIVVVGSAAGLMWLHPVAAAVTLTGLVVTLPVFYGLNLAAVRASKRLEAMNPSASREVQRLYQHVVERPGASRADVRSRLDDGGAVRSATDAFIQRFLAVVRSDFASQLLTAVAMLLLLSYLGIAVIRGALPVAVAAAFVLLLRIMLGAVRSTFNSIATFSRYYPAVARLQRFLDVAPLDDRQRPPAPATDHWAFDLPAATIREVRERVWHPPLGSPLGVTFPARPSRFTAGMLEVALQRGLPDRHAARGRLRLAFVGVAALPSEPTSLAELFAVPAVSLEALDARDQQVLAGAGIHDGSMPLSPEGWSMVGTDTLARIGYLVAHGGAADCVVVDAAVYAAVADRVPGAGGVPIVIWSPGRPADGTDQRPHLVIGANGAIIGCGTSRFVREHWERIAERLEAVAGSAAKTGSDDVDDADDDA